MDTFGDWLRYEIEKRNWKQADLARASYLDSAVISNLINNKRGPGEDTCKAIALAFGYPPEVVFRAAGILEPATEEPEGFATWRYLLEQLSERDREELLQIARLKLERQEQEERRKTTGKLAGKFTEP